jgi:hypothetical protein
MDQEGILYLAFTLVILLMSLILVPYIGKGIVAIIALIIIIAGVVVILILNFADYILVSFICKTLNIIIEPALGYKISKEQNAVMKNVNGLSYASGFVTANLFAYAFKLESSPEQEDAKLITAPEVWERAITNIGVPVKFHVLAMGLDVQKVRDDLEGKRSYQEFQMSRSLQSSSANDVTIAGIQRKINVIQNQMDRISQGEKPIATVMYIETTAIGVSEKAALDMLTQQISDIQVSFSAIDVDLARVVGRELHTLFNFNFGLPGNVVEMSSYFDTQS